MEQPPGGANAVCEQIDIESFKFENVAAFSGKIIIYLLYLVLVLMRGSEFWFLNEPNQENMCKETLNDLKKLDISLICFKE